MKTIAIETKTCPSCGKPVPEGALAGLCPACLLAQGAATETREGGTPHFQPPSLGEISRLFPQLEILGLLGAGGMGAVYKARQPALDRFVALKILPATGSGEINFAERFNREARALARLSHPNIVAVHEFGQTGHLHFFIMEFVDGANLRQLSRASRLSPREALQVIPQICDALQYAHDEGVVHRDIKPENVLVDRKGRVKIADFGLAKILGYDAEAARLTAEGQIMGTPHYMAPEQVERPLTVDHRADIYSLGVVLYELLTGDLPLGKFPPPSRKVQVDVRLDDVVLRALENDPARRYQRASEVKSQVESITSSGTPATARQIAVPSEEKRSSGSGVRYLRWAGIPVVTERNGEREVNFQGALGAVFLTMMVAALAHQIVRWMAGTEHSLSRLVWLAGLFTAFWGLRRTINQPWEKPERAAKGTVILPPKRKFRYLGDALMLVGLFAFVIGSHYLRTAIFPPGKGGLLARSTIQQKAKWNRESGIMVAELPSGGSLELVAVAEVGAAPNQWWRPDGTPAADLTLDLLNAVPPGREEGLNRNMVFRTRDLPEGADGVYFESNPQAMIGSGGEVFAGDDPLSDARPAVFSWRTNPRRATVFAGVSIDPWRTISARDPNNHRTSYFTKPGDPRWDVNIHKTTDGKDGVEITMIMARETRDWRTRIVAVDRNGKEHTYRSASGSATPNGDNRIWTYAFPGLTLKEVKEFQVQVRPVHWVEFPEVSLLPRSSLPVALPLKFSEVLERTFDEWIDFDTGHTGAFPPGKPGEPVFAGIGESVLWAQENGFDAVAGVGELQILDATFAALRDADWDTLTAQQVVDRHHQGVFRPRTLKPTENDGSGRTFAYRTRENGFGILQLLKLDAQRGELHVRFKQILRAGAKPAVQARRDFSSGAVTTKLGNGGSVTLVALKPSHEPSRAWRRPDGSLLAGFECSIQHSNRLSAVEARLFDVLFRLQNLPRPVDMPVFEFAGAIRSAAGGKVVSGDMANDGLLPVQVVWPLSAKSASARLGIPLAEWHTIRSLESFTRSFSKTRIGDDPPWDIEMHTAGVGTKGAQVTVVFGRPYPDWNLRVMASLPGGTLVPGIADTTLKNGPATTTTFVFPGLTLDQVRNFQVQAQPLQWVDLGSLSLTAAIETAKP